jgi:hypothetical protein
MKWIGVIILVIIGILAAIVAVEYLTVSIHNLPSFLPGPHHGRGKEHKRGAIAAVIALVAFVGAAYWAYRIRNAGRPAVAAAGPPTESSSADELLSNPVSTEGDSEGQ